MAVWPAMRGAGEQWKLVEASSGPAATEPS